MKYQSNFINSIFVISLLLGFTLACGDSGPSDETVAALIKRDLHTKGVGVSPNDRIETVAIINRNVDGQAYREEYDLKYGTKYVYTIDLSVTLAGRGSSDYRCQFFQDKSNNDQWRLALCISK